MSNTETPAVPAAPEPLRFHTEIPGGWADWYRAEELPPRRKRAVDVARMKYAPALDRAIRDLEPGVDVRTMSQQEQISMTAALAEREEDITAMFELNDIVAWAYLKAWTRPEPLPSGPDALLDLDRDLYDALLAHSTKIHARSDSETDGFTVDSVTNPNSPTGGSAD